MDRVIAISRVESEDHQVDGLEPLTADMLRSVAASYDPEFRTASVISNYDPATGQAMPGGAHRDDTGFPRLGEVKDLSFDGLTLWAQVSHDERFVDALEAGFTERSVGIRLSNRELDGSPPYLWHVAVSSAEQPGTPNLGPLRMAGESEKDVRIATLETRMANEAEDQEAEETTTDAEETEEETVTYADEDTEAPEADEEPEEEAEEEEGADDAQRMAKLVERLSSRLDEAEKRAERAERMALARTRDAVETQVDSQLERMVAAGKVRPSQTEALRTAALNLKPEARKEFLSGLGRSKTKAGEPVGHRTTTEANVNTKRFSRPTLSGLIPGATHDEIAEVEEMRKRFTDDEGKLDVRAMEREAAGSYRLGGMEVH